MKDRTIYDFLSITLYILRCSFARFRSLIVFCFSFLSVVILSFFFLWYLLLLTELREEGPNLNGRRIGYRKMFVRFSSQR